MAAPLVQRPTYLDMASPDQLVPAAKDAVGAACDACRDMPGKGLIGATLLGVTAAYFAPKFFDFVLTRVRGYGEDQADEFELEEEPQEDER